MKFSPERQSYLSHKITDYLFENDRVSANLKEDLFEIVKQGVQLFVQEWDELHEDISNKISSMKRNITPGSSEWDVLYKQFLEESFRKKSRLFVGK